MRLEALPAYRIIAVNTDPDSENPIHGDETAQRYGFTAGLIPGVSIYGYMTVPLVRQLGRSWLERGWMRIRFRKPFYEGDDLFARAVMVDGDAYQVIAMGDGQVRVTAEAGIESPVMEAWESTAFPLQKRKKKRPPTPAPGLLGSIAEPMGAEHARLTAALRDPLPYYQGPDAVLHPAALLGLSNRLLMENLDLGAWLHAGSELRNFSTAAPGDTLEVRGAIREVFRKKDHEFLTAEILVTGPGGRTVQQVRHTAVWSIGGGPGVLS